MLKFLLTLTLFAQTSDWTNPFPPHKIADNLYYVGSEGLASFLVTSPQGHILINSNLESEVPQLKASVEKLGFRFEDVKILLISHAHWDHNAGSAKIKELTKAKYMVMDADVPEILDGGKSNFQYGRDPQSLVRPTTVDRILHDGDTVRLGGNTLTAHLTPGHTKGCTTWTLTVKDGGKSYNAVIIGSPNVNTGYKLLDNPAYPGMAADFEKTFKVLKSLPCDLFLGAHGAYYGLAAKYPKLKSGGANPFVDPSGYQAYVAEREQAFRKELAAQQRLR